MPKLNGRLALSFAPLVAAGVVVSLGLGACGAGASDPSPTAENIVDVWFADSTQKLQFCEDYERGREPALEQFEKDFEQVEGNPSAREVFDEAASRC